MQKHLGYFSPAFLGPEGSVSLRLSLLGVQLALDPVWEGQPLPGRAPCSAVGLHAFPGVPAGPREALMVTHGLGHHLKGLSSSGLSFLTILSHSFSHKGVEA